MGRRPGLLETCFSFCHVLKWEMGRQLPLGTRDLASLRWVAPSLCKDRAPVAEQLCGSMLGAGGRAGVRSPPLGASPGGSGGPAPEVPGSLQCYRLRAAWKRSHVL